MADNSHDQGTEPRDVGGPIEPAGASEATQPEADLESAVAEPAEIVAAEPPPAFARLKAYCDEHGIKSQIDLDSPFQVIGVEFKNGRHTRTVYIGSEEAADALLQYHLEELVFLGRYSAICSYRERWIEAAVRGAGQVGLRGFVARRRLFGLRGRPDEQEPGELEIQGPKGLALRLTERPGCLHDLEYEARLYLKIDGIGITEHDQALSLLEDLSNSLFLQIDLRFDSPLTLARGRSPRRFPVSRRKLDEDSQLVFPRYSYESSPSSLYWYARSASSMPLLQFLAFYQCLEYYFPQYSRQEAIGRIKNILKNPSFDGTKDSSINAIISATVEGQRGSLREERKQLGATLESCVDKTALLDFLSETDERKHYYSQEYKKISQKKISLSEHAPILEQTADRIYDIRCKVVHTKNLDTGEGIEIILPFSQEEDILVEDVELIKFLARKVLIASGTPLQW